MMPTKAVLSIAEAAEVLGVSDDLIYELTARGELPCLRLGRRKVIPTVAIQAVIDGTLEGFPIKPRPVGGSAGGRIRLARRSAAARSGATPRTKWP